MLHGVLSPFPREWPTLVGAGTGGGVFWNEDNPVCRAATQEACEWCLEHGLLSPPFDPRPHAAELRMSSSKTAAFLLGITPANLASLWTGLKELDPALVLIQAKFPGFRANIL
jgi:hypothetical protein